MKTRLHALIWSRSALLAVFALILAAGAAAFMLSPERLLRTAILRCEDTVANERFSCFRAALERHAPADDIARFVEDASHAFSRRDTFASDYAVLGTNCHTFYHALGDFVATHAQELPLRDQFALGTDACSGGYVMGLYKRLAYAGGFDDALLSLLSRSCKEYENSPGDCAHEIGHVLHDKYTKPILATLDPLTARFLGKPQGVAGEEVTSGAMQSGESTPFEDCRRLLPENAWRACYTGVGHNIFLFVELDPRGVALQDELRACTALENAADRDACAFATMHLVGTNAVAPLFIDGRNAEGVAACDSAAALDQAREGERLTRCYFGVGVGVGLYAESEYPHEVLARGGAPIQADELARYTDACESSLAPFIGECFAGLVGTGFSNLYERSGMQHPLVERALAGQKKGNGSP